MKNEKRILSLNVIAFTSINYLFLDSPADERCSCEVEAFTSSFIFSLKQTSQYATALPAARPGTSSLFSNTEH